VPPRRVSCTAGRLHPPAQRHAAGRPAQQQQLRTLSPAGASPALLLAGAAPPRDCGLGKRSPICPGAGPLAPLAAASASRAIMSPLGTALRASSRCSSTCGVGGVVWGGWSWAAMVVVVVVIQPYTGPQQPGPQQPRPQQPLQPPQQPLRPTWRMALAPPMNSGWSVLM
jgi:hypothetical protein